MKELRETNNLSECLQAVLMTAPHASASIVRKSSAAANEIEGVIGVYFAEDLDGGSQTNLFAREKIEYFGQAVGLVVGRSRSCCLEALEKIEVEYHAAPGVLDVVHAKAVRNVLGEEHILKRGDPGRELNEDELSVEGNISIGSQYPVSCGILLAKAEPLTDESKVRIQVPAESPCEVRAAVARVTGFSESQVIVEGMSIRGSSGGRGAESVQVASIAAMIAVKLGQAVSLELDGNQEAALTGKRHAVEAEFKVGFDKSGVILAADIDLVMDGGAENGHGQAVLDRAILNVDGAYGIADFRVRGRLCRTNGLTGDSIAAEGSTQGILVMEEIITRVARKLGKTADTIRELNFYRAKKGGAVTPYGQKVDIDLLSRLWIKITSASELHDRREAVDKWNQKNHVCKRGIAAVPIKMGIGDPEMNNNQASVCVQVFLDGSVRVKMGAVDVGDGLLLRTKKQVSDLLGVAETRVDVCGSEEGDSALSLKPYVVDIQALIFGAVKDACGQLNDRLGKYEGQEESRKTSFGDRVTEAGGKGENLTALGFFKLAGKGWDSDRFHGSPFSEYFYGGAVVEVEVDALSGEVQVLRADLFCAGAETECAELDRAQISRSYMMGQGWMLSEDVNLHPYAIPGIEEAPIDFRIEMTGVESAGKKAPRCVSCAEAPVALGIATRYALKDAIFAYAPETRSDVDLPVPAGPDATMRAIRDISRESSILKRERKKSGEKG